MAKLVRTLRSKIDLPLILDQHAYDTSSRYGCNFEGSDQITLYQVWALTYLYVFITYTVWYQILCFIGVVSWWQDIPRAVPATTSVMYVRMCVCTTILLLITKTRTYTFAFVLPRILDVPAKLRLHTYFKQHCSAHGPGMLLSMSFANPSLLWCDICTHACASAWWYCFISVGDIVIPNYAGWCQNQQN